ncbi:MAG TPA: hypothetical protein VGM19_14970 [Armatimonadota bacterium]|jgi:hypothetical protein
MKRVLSFALILLLGVAALATAADLPLQRVVLFSTGVGYFQRGGTVEGDATVLLSFKVDQINDMLKSLIVQDLGGGMVGPVTYAPREPLAHTLGSFSVNLADNPSLAELLNRLRGSEVTVTGVRNTRGLVLGVEAREVTVKDKTESVEFLNLLTPQGFASLPLAGLTSIKLSDDKTTTELTSALGVIAASRNQDKREVQLNFTGKGQREVRAGYLLETPVWKTTYRLVADTDKLYLQGWAIVENTSDMDWNNVQMALVSGRPISFTQDLYEPLFATRPDVPVAMPVPVTPRTYEGTMGEAPPPPSPAEEAMSAPKAGAALRRMEYAAAPAAPGFGGGRGGNGMNQGLDRDAMAASMTAIAQGQNVGELFSYTITQPITLARQKAAMIPIVSADLTGEKVSLFDATSNPTHPLNALRLKNTTGLHLMAGPVTVLAGGAYAGDALLDDLNKGDERLITYAVDLTTEVAVDPALGQTQIVSLKIDKGVLLVSSRNHVETTFTIKNRGEEARNVLIQLPARPGWSLLEPAKPAEQTANYWRFAVAVAPGATEKLTVKQEQPIMETMALFEGDPLPRLQYYMRAAVISDQVKTALQGFITRRDALQQVADQLQTKQNRLAEITKEQDRIRQNMAQLDRTSDLYKKYVTKLTAQEDEYDTTVKEIADLQKQQQTMKDELSTYLHQLQAE